MDRVLNAFGLAPLAVLIVAGVWIGPLARPAQGALVVQIGRNFTGSSYQTDSFARPPDSDGAIGLNHFVELINGRYSVYSKSSGARVRTTTDIQFWKNAGVDLGANLDVTDPRVVFDTYSQRWFASMVDVDFSTQMNNRFLIAISDSADPTGTWHGFAFPTDPVDGNFGDFPTLGVDADGVYLSGDMFDATGDSVGATLVSIPKSGLLADPPDISGLTSFGILSYEARGNILQPAVTTGTASTGESVLAVGDLGYDFQPHTNLLISTIENAAIPGGATLPEATVLTGLAYSVPINPTQPDGSSNLDDGDARIGACVRRVDDILYAVHAVEVNDRAAIRWYRIDAAHHSLIQAGTISDDHLDLFYPSIAANPSGTVVIGCNGSSSNVFVSSYAVVGETVDGVLTFGNLLLLKAGKASYQSLDSDSGASRWGDYSATSGDPADPSRFWTIQAIPTAKSIWATQITELITSPVALTVTFASTNILVSWPAAATGFQLQYSPTVPPTENWARVTNSPAVANNQFTLSLPLSGNAGFFRLAKP
jgi:hypothetical protein